MPRVSHIMAWRSLGKDKLDAAEGGVEGLESKTRECNLLVKILRMIPHSPRYKLPPTQSTQSGCWAARAQYFQPFPCL